MVNKLPKIKYKGNVCVVDFKLGEMRCGKGLKIIPFTSLKEDKRSKLKSTLRGLRFRTYKNEYIPGVDD